MDIEKGVFEGLDELSVEGFRTVVRATMKRFNGLLTV